MVFWLIEWRYEPLIVSQPLAYSYYFPSPFSLVIPSLLYRMHSNSCLRPMNWKTGLRRSWEPSGTTAGTRLGWASIVRTSQPLARPPTHCRLMTRWRAWTCCSPTGSCRRPWSSSAALWVDGRRRERGALDETRRFSTYFSTYCDTALKTVTSLLFFSSTSSFFASVSLIISAANTLQKLFQLHFNEFEDQCVQHYLAYHSLTTPAPCIIHDILCFFFCIYTMTKFRYQRRTSADILSVTKSTPRRSVRMLWEAACRGFALPSLLPSLFPLSPLTLHIIINTLLQRPDIDTTFLTTLIEGIRLTLPRIQARPNQSRLFPYMESTTPQLSQLVTHRSMPSPFSYLFLLANFFFFFFHEAPQKETPLFKYV